MSADYLISGLPGLCFDAPPATSMEKFLSDARSQLSASDADGIEAIVAGTPSSHPMVAKWRDIDTQMRNAIAVERARKAEKDPAKWLRSAEGCSLFWKNRIVAAFNEKDPASRERLIDLARFEAADELVPVTSPLSVAAVFAYAVKLSIVLRRAAMNANDGNGVFDSLTAASSPETIFKEKAQ